MSDVGVGIIGIGKMGRTHLDGMRDVKRARNVALTDPAGAQDAASALAEEYGVVCEGTVANLVSRSDIDAVVVTTPHALHAEHVLPALQAGKHVLVEKPMDVTLANCDRILDAAAAANVKLMVAQSHRYWEGDVVAKRLLDEGAVGTLLMCRDTLASAGFRSPNLEKPWFTDPDLYGPGGLLGWGVHNIDRLRWWFEDEATGVYASAYPLRTDIPGDLTSNMVAVNFRKGGSAHLWYSEAFPTPGWRGFSCGAQLVGDRGLMDVDPYGQVKVAREGSTEWETVYDISEVDDPRQKAFSSEDRDFIRCIVDDTDPPVTGADGRAAVEICLAAYRSAETGGSVSLPLAG